MSDAETAIVEGVARGQIVAPRARPADGYLTWDVSGIHQAEQRTEEVSTVTRDKAPELLATFNKAYADASEIRTRLEYELDVVKNEIERLRASIILDRVPTILREKGLASAKSPAGSEDLRTAIINSDPDYRELVDRRGMLECVIALVKVKADKIQRAYSSVSKLVGDGSLRYNLPSSSMNGNPNSDFGQPFYKR